MVDIIWPLSKLLVVRIIPKPDWQVQGTSWQRSLQILVRFRAAIWVTYPLRVPACEGTRLCCGRKSHMKTFAPTDTEYMRALFKRGYDMAALGYPWHKVPSDYDD